LPGTIISFTVVPGRTLHGTTPDYLYSNNTLPLKGCFEDFTLIANIGADLTHASPYVYLSFFKALKQ
jgi:hypothetical protein